MDFRIKVDTDKDNAYIQLPINQTFDELQLLSLTVNSENIYKLDSSDNGIVAGRVIANGGYGVPNAKVTLFLPLSESDSSDEYLTENYPFKTPFDKKGEKRFNVLPSWQTKECHVPVGDFPSKQSILSDKKKLNLFKKYHKFTTSTNKSGDYILTNIPKGDYYIHMDVDISDIDFFSLRPYDLVANGQSDTAFKSLSVFSKSNRLETLPQINSFTNSLYVRPVWGSDETETGITIQHFFIEQDLTPHSLLVGGVYSDIGAGRVNKKCRPRRKMARNCNLRPVSGFIDTIVRTEDGFTTGGPTGEIDEDGNFFMYIPMTDNRMITAEDGTLTLSNDPAKGIPTSTSIRARVTPIHSDFGILRGLGRTASYLLPNLYNRFEFDDTTHDDDFFDMSWKKLYTTSQYIPRLQKDANPDGNHTGLKLIGDCDENYPLPYNRLRTTTNVLYTILSSLVGFFAAIMKILNAVNLFGNKYLECNGEELPPDEWKDCVQLNLAKQFGIIQYDFYNNWVNGSLYAPLFTIKTKYRNGVISSERYCDYDCSGKVNTAGQPNEKNKCRNLIRVEHFDFTDTSPFHTIDRGIILKYEDIFYYVARSDVEKNISTTGDLLNREHHKLMYATNIIEIGAIEKCDYQGIPQIIRELDGTSYNEDDDADVLGRLNALGVDKLNRSAIEKMCQVGANKLSKNDEYTLSGSFTNLPQYDSNTDDKTDFVAFETNDAVMRKYLCEKWNAYQNGIYQLSVNSPSNLSFLNDFDEEDNTEEPISYDYDECVNCDSDADHSKRVIPYYFYFGVPKGRNAFDETVRKYFQKC